jgi:glycosyltransferase involved in cell wall biosynthesis
LFCLKVLPPRTQAVFFLHVAHDVHLVDKVVNKIAMQLSDAMWADSSVPLKQRVPRRLERKGRVISFSLKLSIQPQSCDPALRFISWGRLNAQKGLERALKLFATISKRRHVARFTIISPDGGMEEDLRMLVSELGLGLGEQVTLKGPMPQDEIVCCAAQSSFYLHTSRNEGMAMSVVEAMQAGLFPVVTPVGEIARYCQDGQSAIFVYNDVSAANAVLVLLSEPERYKRISRAAAEFWQEKPLYRDDFLAAAKELIEGREHEV